MKGIRKVWLIISLLALVVLFSYSAVSGQDDGGKPIAIITAGSSRLEWQPQVEYAQLVLTVSGPDGFDYRQEFEAGVVPTLSLVDLPDGQYTYELLVVPILSLEAQQALTAVREADADTRLALEQELRMEGVLPQQVQLQSGSFRVEGGAAITGGDNEVGDLPQGIDSAQIIDVPTDQVILDDLIVDGSACIGFDCVNGESFGFDTIRLKENNLRIKFQDTSSSASFPTNDWQITINDSANGGSSYFGVDDITGGRSPFRLLAGAPSNSLYVNSSGNVGLGTSTPVMELHLNDNDTPTVRLEQNGSGGWTPQTWDVAGNEANFFIRDVTNGSKLPFRIRPGAPTSSIYIAADGDVGIGTASPEQKLDVRGSAQIKVNAGSANLIFDAADTGNDQYGFLLFRDQGTNSYGLIYRQSSNDLYVYDYINNAFIWRYDELSRNFVFEDSNVNVGIGTSVPTEKLDVHGNIVATGTINGSSDVALKENFVPVEGSSILRRIAELPITSWNFKDEGSEIRHIGPMAQDFYAAFGLGADNRHIATVDADGVAMAGIQELYRMIQDRDVQIEDLREQNDELSQRLDELEVLVNALLEAQKDK